MKKLLTIMVLGLLLSGNAYAEKINIKCVGKYTDNFVIDLKSKTWNNASSKKSLAKKVYIDDQIIVETHFMKYKMPCFRDGTCLIGMEIINRLTGEYNQIFLKIPKKELHKEWFEAKPIFESEKKFIERARDFIGQKSLIQKYLKTYYSSQCSLGKRKF